MCRWTETSAEPSRLVQGNDWSSRTRSCLAHYIDELAVGTRQDAGNRTPTTGNRVNNTRGRRVHHGDVIGLHRVGVVVNGRVHGSGDRHDGAVGRASDALARSTGRHGQKVRGPTGAVADEQGAGIISQRQRVRRRSTRRGSERVSRQVHGGQIVRSSRHAHKGPSLGTIHYEVSSHGGEGHQGRHGAAVGIRAVKAIELLQRTVGRGDKESAARANDEGLGVKT